MRRSLWILASLLVMATACKKPTPPRDRGQPPPAPAPAPAPEGSATSTAPAVKAPTAPGAWREMLRSSDPKVRSQALEAMPTDTREEPPAELLGALQDANEGVRRAAVGAILGFILHSASTSAIPKLLDLAQKDPSPQVRADALRAVGNSSHRDVVPRLVALFRAEKEAGIRGQILSILARSGDRRALAVLRGQLRGAAPPQAVFDGLRVLEKEATADLLKLLDHSAAEVRRRAAATLGEIGDRAAVPKLRRALSDRDPQMVQAAADALAMLGGDDALRDLLKLAEQKDASHPAIALRALAGFRDGKALAGRAVLAAALPHLKGGTEEVRVAAAQLLGSAGARPAVAALRRAATAKDAPTVRIAALEALGRIGGAGALAALAAGLRDSDPRVRMSAALTVGRMNAAGRPATAALLAAWRRKDAPLELKSEILTALGRIGAVAAVPLLRKVATGDPVSLLRVLAAGALLRMERSEGIGAIRPFLSGTGHWQERREAARILEARSWRERRAAAKSASGQKFAGAVAQLILDALAKEQEPLVREVLYTQLAKARGPIAAQAQRQALSEQVPFFRLMAAAGLCRNGEAKGCEVVVAGLNHPDATIRAEAARRAGWYRVKQARAVLERLFEDPVVFVANAARDAARRL